LTKHKSAENLSQAEVEFRARLKETYLGLLTIEKIRACQRARLSNIKYGDVNSKLFYLRAMVERGKNTSKYFK
jgi:uncharacterized protein YnzC (UPF0291/DUF896 family)